MHSDFSSEGVFQQAETHLLVAGNRDSARSFAEMMAAWLPVGGDPGAFATEGLSHLLKGHDTEEEMRAMLADLRF